MVPDASSSVQLCVYVNLFSCPLGPRVAPHVPALRSSGPPFSLSHSETLASAAVPNLSLIPLFSLRLPPSLPPTGSCVHTPSFTPCWLLSKKKKRKKKDPGIHRMEDDVRFSSPSDRAPQWVRVPSISPGVDVGL